MELILGFELQLYICQWSVGTHAHMHTNTNTHSNTHILQWTQKHILQTSQKVGPSVSHLIKIPRQLSLSIITENAVMFTFPGQIRYSESLFAYNTSNGEDYIHFQNESFVPIFDVPTQVSRRRRTSDVCAGDEACAFDLAITHDTVLALATAATGQQSLSLRSNLSK